MSLGPFVGTVAAILAILGAVAGGLVILRSSATRAAAEVWRAEAEAQKARADRLEQEIGSLESRVAALETDNARLTDLVTGQSAIADLAKLLASQHRETMSMLRRGTNAR